jgi:diaminohydroxyphosphoribosylaminopyrimidine deaminase/5-amino-6-(5-phosphoribosylamino)uracil reductase
VKFSARDIRYMTRALHLAARGQGRTSPNPTVGAVVISGGRIVGQGFHPKAGAPHAEALALTQAGARAKGGTLYVTLEPCSHTNKRTPPCVPAIAAAGIRRVVAAMQDPNPQVKGDGIRRLRKAGLNVAVGCLEAQAAQLNEGYLHRMKTGRPFVTLKAAITLDGKIATARGESKWITGPPARRHAHHLRSRMDAILVGIGTVLADNPRLTVRVGRPVRQPLRVILDSRLRIPTTARILSRQMKQGTVIMTTTRAPKSRLARLRRAGVAIHVLPTQDRHASLRACLSGLGKIGVNNLLIEGGGEVIAAALQAGVVNRLHLYVAPKLLGGQNARSVVGGVSPSRLTQALAIRNLRVKRLGSDFLLEGTL